MLFCRDCGGKSPEEALFCAHCGHRLQPLAEEATSVSGPHTSQVMHTPPPETPTLLSRPLQAVPSKDGKEKEEEEEEKRRVMPPVVPPEPAGTGNVPSVQGTPQV